MNKKKGFTLVELLAVVVVLGIISVISVPVVKNITKDAKEKGLQKQIDVILESAKNWAVQNTDLLPEGASSILVKVDTLKKEGLLENKKIINPVNNKEMNKCAKISYNENYNQYEYEYTECHALNGIINSTTDECATKGQCTMEEIKTDEGVKVTVQVNDSKTYDFYVINDDGETLTLLMSENLGNTVFLNDDAINNGYGTITAINYLDELTDDEWSNIPSKAYTYSGIGDDGTTRVFEDITRTMRARMITYAEVNAIKIANNGTMPTYLYGNLSSSNTTEAPYGYWTSTIDAISPDFAWFVYYAGRLDTTSVTDSDDYYGLRPVIEISKHATIY